MSHEAPSWSADPIGEFKLEVLKDGQIVDVVKLEGKQFFVLGRQPDVVDIQMDHPSTSRRHAVLNFRDDGALMLLDLASAQGTYLNKKRCERDTYYRVYVGDMMKFGCSTRHYILCGPEDQRPPEYESENVIEVRKNIAIKRIELEHRKKKEEEEEENAGAYVSQYAVGAVTVILSMLFAWLVPAITLWPWSWHSLIIRCHALVIHPSYTSINLTHPGISWGFREDAVGTYSDEDNDDDNDNGDVELPDYLKNQENYDRKFGDKFEAGIDDSEARNEKDRAVLEKIRKRELKVQHMQEENRRIFNKEGSQDNGLTEGQLKAVARNDENIKRLTVEIGELVATIKSKNLQRAENEKRQEEAAGGCDGGAAANRKRIFAERGSDDVEFDTSAATADASTNWRMRKKLAAAATASSTAGTGVMGKGKE